MIYLSSLHKSNGKLSFYKKKIRVKVALNLGSFFHLHDGLLHRVTGYANGAP
jgi:hypothetical protein